jgi:chromosomal replication initiation ATPase DnaA
MGIDRGQILKKLVAESLDLKPEDIRVRHRAILEHANAIRIFCALAQELLPFASLRMIGGYIDTSKHNTVIYYLTSHHELLLTDRLYKKLYLAVKVNVDLHFERTIKQQLITI